MSEKEALLDLARSQLGEAESPLGSNRVKYNTAYYGREVSGSAYPWCCVFQWWLFREAGLPALFYGGGKTASCTALWNHYKKEGRTVDKTRLRPGDLVFFVFDGGKSGCMNHVGLCERVEEGYVTTIDGNTGSDEANGGAVARKRRALSWVGGAARPGYESRDEQKEEKGEEEMKLYHSIDEMPAWARPAVRKALENGYIRVDESGNAGVWEPSLQPLVWMDRAGLLDRPAREEETAG